MLKLVAAAALLLFAVTQPSAYAANCEGQKGKVIFEDDFSDDSGGWGADRDASFGKSGLTLHLQDPNATWSYLNNTFNATEGNFCVEAVLPKPAAADIPARIGLIFLANDTNNNYVLMISNEGLTHLYRKDAGNWVKLGEASDLKPKPEPESVVALRAVVKANLITVSVNGIEVKKQRIQQPLPNLKFGIYAQSDKAAAAPGVDFKLKKYRVTAGE